MAITTDRNIGRTRIRLAKLLGDALTRYYNHPVTVEPWHLWSQNPFYSGRYMDCCNWGCDLEHTLPTSDGKGTYNGHIHIASWAPMRQVIREYGRSGIVLEHNSQDLPGHFEI